jgi:DNA-binding transcriptional regulator/RsmH inhibitor MraZ
VVIGVLDRIEIWDYDKYKEFQLSKPVDMSRFAEEVMGNIEKDNK